MASGVNWMRDEDVETGDSWKMILIIIISLGAKMCAANSAEPDIKTRRTTVRRLPLFIADSDY